MKLLLLVLVLICDVRAVTTNPTATFVYGQGGSFTTRDFADPPTANSLRSPTGIIYDAAGNTYIADSNNYRVLFYPAGSATATRVYGQGGNFTRRQLNFGGISADSLSVVNGLAINGTDYLFVADSSNSRILVYPSASTTAVYSYGQGGSLTTSGAGATAGSFSSPRAIALDGSGNLYVCDLGNSRVLKFNQGVQTAVAVWGQAGSFTSGLPNLGNIFASATSLNNPSSVAVAANGLYIADTSNNRVLFYENFGTTATRVYGQTSFDSNTVLSTSATSLSSPTGLALNPVTGGLYVSDSGNNRILYYPPGQTTATAVYGQGGSFTSSTSMTTSSTSIRGGPNGMAANANNLLVSNTNDNRALIFAASNETTTPPSAMTPCFHVSTIITYKGKDYTGDEIRRGLVAECKMPHIVVARGYQLDIECSNQRITQLRLTDEHLIVDANGNYVTMASFQVGQQVRSINDEVCVVFKKTREFNQAYFGLNCLASTVSVDGLQVSTFGNLHYVPAAWMGFMGRIIGIDYASSIGDRIAQYIFRMGLL